ncbi:MAG: gamma-glutamyltranspeptidase [Pseudomonadota bacterium]
MTAAAAPAGAIPFAVEKTPARAARGMVVTNHPLASAAGAEMLAAGGNAVDAAVAALFALSVVEPMMVGPLGGGFAHLRRPDGRHEIVEGQGRCPAGVGPTSFEPDPSAPPGALDAIGRRNAVGRTAVAVPGTLAAWCELVARHGRLSLADVIEPAVRHAGRGFAATPYLADCVADCAADLARDPEIARVFMPGGAPIAAGTRVVNGALADTLRLVARKGAAALYDGAIGRALADDMALHGAWLSREDLARYRTSLLEPLHARYRGFEIVGPPPPCSGPLHIGQMLALLEGFDLRAAGFASADASHLLAEALKIAFADRAAATADPEHVPVPIARLLSAEYAALRRADVDPARARAQRAGVAPDDGAHTTHLTVADRDGWIVSATQTINSLFGARYMVPGTGLIPNNYLYVFDPHPGRANSLAPGKRVTSSMAPLIVLRDGAPRWALGLPGGLRIFPSAMQALVNLIDHGMSLQQAVEAPRLWTQGFQLELEPGFPDAVADALRARGHDVLRVANVGGGMCAVGLEPDGTLEGAACWRADGTPIGVGGGLARPGVRFLPEVRRP